MRISRPDGPATGPDPCPRLPRRAAPLDGLLTNPGLLWPKIADDEATLRLALGGAIPDTAIEYQAVGLFAAEFFVARYPALVVARDKLPAMPASGTALLEEIGRRRGCLQRGGVLDLYKAADILVHEFRTGKLGRISLESPPAG